MHGTNRVRSSERNPDRLQVHKIFPTIQGEGPFSGVRCVFIRLTGCNLRCWWCDTEWDDDGDPTRSTSQIVEATMELAKEASPLVVITGGEPLRQDLGRLIPELIARGATVQIETAGSLYQDVLTQAIVVVSPKTPVVHPRIPEVASYWKYPIIAGHIDPEDGLPVTNTQYKNKPVAPLARPPVGFNAHKIYITPVDLQDDILNLANESEVARIALQFGYTAQVQLHKHLGVE